MCQQQLDLDLQVTGQGWPVGCLGRPRWPCPAVVSQSAVTSRGSRSAFSSPSPLEGWSESPQAHREAAELGSQPLWDQDSGDTGTQQGGFPFLYTPLVVLPGEPQSRSPEPASS